MVVAYLTRGGGVLMALGSGLAGAAAGPMVFELPFVLIITPVVTTRVPHPLFLFSVFLVVILTTLALPTFSSRFSVTRYSLYFLGAMFVVFAAWALLTGYAPPSDPASFSLNAVSKVLGFAAVVASFSSGARKGREPPRLRSPRGAGLIALRRVSPDRKWWTRKAILWHPAGGGRIVCDACNRRCSIPEGSHGFCYVRKNVGGKLYLASYGKLAAMQIDPIEKKPFNHFYPGTHVFTVGTVSCNWHCHPAGTRITLADGSTKRRGVPGEGRCAMVLRCDERGHVEVEAEAERRDGNSDATRGTLGGVVGRHKVDSEEKEEEDVDYR